MRELPDLLVGQNARLLQRVGEVVEDGPQARAVLPLRVEDLPAHS